MQVSSTGTPSRCRASANEPLMHYMIRYQLSSDCLCYRNFELGTLHPAPTWYAVKSPLINWAYLLPLSVNHLPVIALVNDQKPSTNRHGERLFSSALFPATLLPVIHINYFLNEIFFTIYMFFFLIFLLHFIPTIFFFQTGQVDLDRFNVH